MFSYVNKLEGKSGMSYVNKDCDVTTQAIHRGGAILAGRERGREGERERGREGERERGELRRATHGQGRGDFRIEGRGARVGEGRL